MEQGEAIVEQDYKQFERLLTALEALGERIGPGAIAQYQIDRLYGLADGMYETLNGCAPWAALGRKR